MKLVVSDKLSKPPYVGCYEVGGGGAREQLTALPKRRQHSNLS
jgi:hypothetical protein